MINQYFGGIKKTNVALKKLIEYFDKEKESVIIISLGDNVEVYYELGINFFFLYGEVIFKLL